MAGLFFNAVGGLAVFLPFALLTPYVSLNWLSGLTAVVFGAPGTALLAAILNFAV